MNPLTYIVDITRAGVYAQVSDFVNLEVIIITILAIIAFSVAAVSMLRIKV